MRNGEKKNSAKLFCSVLGVARVLVKREIKWGKMTSIQNQPYGGACIRFTMYRRRSRCRHIRLCDSCWPIRHAKHSIPFTHFAQFQPNMRGTNQICDYTVAFRIHAQYIRGCLFTFQHPTSIPNDVITTIETTTFTVKNMSCENHSIEPNHVCAHKFASPKNNLFWTNTSERSKKQKKKITWTHKMFCVLIFSFVIHARRAKNMPNRYSVLLWANVHTKTQKCSLIDFTDWVECAAVGRSAILQTETVDINSNCEPNM